MSKRLWKIGTLLVLGLGLAACAAPDDEYGQCEAGLAQLSSTANLVPGNC